MKIYFVAVLTALLLAGSPMPASAVAPAAPATNAPSAAVPALNLDDLRKSAEAGDVNAEVKLAAAYHNGKGVPEDDTQTFNWAMKAAIQGNVDAEQQVAYLYYYGHGTAKDFAKAAQWYEKAAAQGNADALTGLAPMYDNGYGVAKDTTHAFNLYLQAAQRGLPAAAYTVGCRYLNGVGTKADPSQALHWLQVAAQQRYADAWVKLGDMYRSGIGVPIDLKKAFTYYLTGHDSAYACDRVADFYAHGLFVPRDPVMAYAWSLRALERQSTPDIQKYADALKAQLTPDLVEAAQLHLVQIDAQNAGKAQAPNMSTSFDQGSKCVINCTIVSGAILVPVATPDHKPAFLMLDTGSTHSILTEDYARSLGLNDNSYLSFSGIGPEPSLVRLSNQDTFTIPGLTFHHVTWVVMPGFNLDSYFGMPVVGILGLDLINDFVLHIDYPGQNIELTGPKAFVPPTSPDVVLPLTSSLGLNWIQATVEGQRGKATGYFLIDTGDGSTLGLTKTFQNHNPGLYFDTRSQGGAMGVGGMVSTHLAIAPAFTFNNFTMPNVPVSLQDSAVGSMATVDGGGTGSEIWRRFDVTLDFPGLKMYLRKNSHFSDPYVIPQAGMLVQATGPDYSVLTVTQLVPGAPATKAGFQIGDVIVSIDEIKGHPLRRSDLQLMMEMPRVYHITVMRGGATVPILLKVDDRLTEPATAK